MSAFSESTKRDGLPRMRLDASGTDPSPPSSLCSAATSAGRLAALASAPPPGLPPDDDRAMSLAIFPCRLGSGMSGPLTCLNRQCACLPLAVRTTSPANPTKLSSVSLSATGTPGRQYDDATSAARVRADRIDAIRPGGRRDGPPFVLAEPPSSFRGAGAGDGCWGAAAEFLLRCITCIIVFPKDNSLVLPLGRGGPGGPLRVELPLGVV